MRKARGGFTIVETLIFLAVSGTMFIIAFYGMRGQQDSVGFRQSLNGMEQKIREIFNNVDNGYFGNTGQYTCSAPGPSYRIITPFPASTSGGGNSGDCVFIGKTVDFNGSDKSKMNIATLIGSRLAENLIYNTTLIEASQLAETYAINNGVKWSNSYLYDTVSGSYTNKNNLRVSAQRNRNAEDNVQADLRAQRKYYADGAWSDVSNSQIPMFCFELGNRKGSIKITQKDINVDYNGAGC
jgi:type II secretory pathway pseudopilin PulG